MTVAFNQIPGNLRVPFFYAEVNAGESPYQSNARLLLIGQMLSTGIATPNQPIVVSGSEDGLFGLGSMLADMYKVARLNAPFQEIWCLPLVDATGATAAAGTITIGASPTASGTLVLYISGIRVPVAITAGMTVTQVASAIVSAVSDTTQNLYTRPLVVTATSAAGVATITGKNAGTIYNSLRIEQSMAVDEMIPLGMTVTIVQPTGGASDPTTLNSALANLGSELFDWIAMPYSDSGDLATMDSFLQQRWGPYSQVYGHCLTAKDGQLGALQTFTATQNAPFTSILATRNYASAPHVTAAALGAIAAMHLQDAPELSRPLQTLQLQGVVGPKLVSDRWSITERQSLYYSGLGACTVAADGTVALDRVTTTYQTNAYAQPDMSWLDINTRAQIMYGLRYIQQKVTQDWGRAALVDDNVNNLQGFADPPSVRDTIVHAYVDLVALGVFENADEFQTLLIVERNANDPNRLDCYLPVDAVNQLRIMAVNATSFLQYPTS